MIILLLLRELTLSASFFSFSLDFSTLAPLSLGKDTIDFIGRWATKANDNNKHKKKILESRHTHNSFFTYYFTDRIMIGKKGETVKQRCPSQRYWITSVKKTEKRCPVEYAADLR